MSAYYNEIDPHAAQWLRNLIAAGHIAPGEVDERDIRDVRPDDLREFDQCHFFAGIGVWSYALRRAGWDDDRPVWTGSCPCQPFSVAGVGRGMDDERHLWPFFHHLIRVRQPAVVFGEQVASKDADPWIDLVQDDLEALGYAVGAIPFPSAGVGAPHIRDRLYWVADACSIGREWRQNPSGPTGKGEAQRGQSMPDAECSRVFSRLGDSHNQGLEGQRCGHQAEGGRVGAVRPATTSGESGRMANTERGGWSEGRAGAESRIPDANGTSCDTGPTNGFWRDADWLGCRDGKWRPVEPGTFPLAHGAPARVGRLRAYGNAINAEAAVAFIEVAMEVMP